MTHTADDRHPPPPDRALPRVSRLQDRIAVALGVSRARRIETVVAMLENNARRAPGYWIQLTLAMGIATLGLVLGSTAVVIGAMLVSPLMGPILELGMGFAVGSSLLVIRAALRVALSVATVMLGAAALTVALPFHEVTSEIASRTAPTALDLLVAVFCALTAAYTTVRASADTTAAAAGTAIGIALVPPLCVTGFGLGTASPSVAGGAALLFTANFSAILVFAVFSFLALGFNQVDAATLEHDYLERDATRTERLAERVHAGLRAAFGSRHGLAMRLLVPVFFLLAVYVPLSRALDEVSWEVRTRAGIRRLLADEAPGAVQTSLALERHAVALRLLVVDRPDNAASLERRLDTRIAALAGVAPTVTVVAVPDARALAAAAAEDVRTADGASSVPLALGAVALRVGEAVRDAWPEPAGPLVGWRLDLTAGAEPTVTVQHLGAPLGTAGEALLASAVSTRLGETVRVAGVALPAAPLVAARGEESAWLVGAAAAVRAAARSDSLVACVAGRLGPSPRPSADDRVILGALRAAAAARPVRLVVDGGDAWSVRVARGSCAPPLPPVVAVPVR